jgi:hypothetical protein
MQTLNIVATNSSKKGAWMQKTMIVKGNWCDHLLSGIGLWHPMVSGCHYVKLSYSNVNKNVAFKSSMIVEMWQFWFNPTT